MEDKAATRRETGRVAASSEEPELKAIQSDPGPLNSSDAESVTPQD